LSTVWCFGLLAGLEGRADRDCTRLETGHLDEAFEGRFHEKEPRGRMHPLFSPAEGESG